jgi:ABC-type molybdate transport system substrate-binding protein
MMTTMSVSAAEIQVMSGGAPKEVFAQLTPKFEQQTGNKVEFTYAVITELREKLGAGVTADVLVLPTPVLDSLARDGKVRADSRAIFGTVGISVVVRTSCWLLPQKEQWSVFFESLPPTLLISEPRQYANHRSRYAAGQTGPCERSLSLRASRLS